MGCLEVSVDGIEKEGRLIAAIDALWRGRENQFVALSGGDDCGILRSAGGDHEFLLTCDQIIENRHFIRDRHSPEALGRKALVRSLSDIAAMGGEPLGFLQTVCLPDWAVGPWHAAFQRGMRDAANDPQVERLALIGGDIAAGSLFVATTTVIGRVERGTALRRSGARAGDLLCVSGTLGGSALGLAALLGAGDRPLTELAVTRHCAPFPRVALGRALRGIPATAAIDLSDGLAIDASRLASASGVAVVIDAEAVPLFPGADADLALRSGEEYELLFTIPPESSAPPALDISVIGHVEAGDGTWLCSGGTRVPLRPEGYSHF